jgi:hypothetical protein
MGDSVLGEKFLYFVYDDVPPISKFYLDIMMYMIPICHVHLGMFPDDIFPKAVSEP